MSRKERRTAMESLTKFWEDAGLLHESAIQFARIQLAEMTAC